MDEQQPNELKKSRKEIKWYTYVDSILNRKLNEFMEQYNITNQAKIIRNSVNFYLNYVESVLQKHPELKEYDDTFVDEFIKKAINGYELTTNLYDELKQKISPLKLSILMLNNFSKDDQKMNEGIEDVKKALFELESTIKRHFEVPKLTRHLQKFDILYVEDNELERRTLNTYFKTKGMEIKTYETSEEALEILKSSTPQIILLDIDLKTSNINGVKLCQILKSKVEYKNIPIILISAVISRKEKEEILTIAGADDIIIKPIDKLSDLDILFKYIK